MAITITAFESAVNAALDLYIKGEALHQHIQERPLLAALEARKKSFPSGKDSISRAVQGAHASDDAAFFLGYEHDDTVTYTHPDNLLRAKYDWVEVHCGINFTGTELKQDGLSVVDSLSGAETSAHSGREVTVLTDMIDNKLKDMADSHALEMDRMLHQDGSQDALELDGLLHFLSDTPAVGTTGNLNRATYAWWRHRALTGANKITANADTQALTRKLRYEVRQLTRYGGKPNIIIAGSDFIDALELEVQAKGIYTESGFANAGKTDIGMADISMRGVGRVQYDPTLDNLGLSKKAFILDGDKFKLMPMEGEDRKTHSPARPYDQYCYLRAITWTGGLVCWQLNANGVYEVA